MMTRRRELLIGAASWLALACAESLAPEAAAPSPEPRSQQERPIVVVGAGLAGLTAALTLVNSGRDVVVLEAQQRPGGRILTLRVPSSGDLFVEAGAAHVVGDPDLLELIRTAGVNVVRPKGPEGLHTVEYFDGKRSRFAPGEEAPERYQLSAEEKQLGFVGCIRKYFGAAARADVTAAWPPPELASTDQQSCLELLTTLGASRGYIESFQDGFLGEGAARTSGAFVLREMASFLRDFELSGGGRIEGGSDRLPFGLAAKLGARIKYGAVVQRLEQDERGVRVQFELAGERQSLHAERVVCAIPFSVLRQLEVAPRFSPAKERAVQELGMVTVARIYAAFDRRFWQERGEAGDAENDLLARVRDETKLQPGSAGVLGCYISGDAARRLTALSEAERVKSFMQVAEKVHPGAAAHLARGFSKCWDEDPFARGAYAFFRPGELTALGAVIPEPEGCIHFAGDHTSHRPGWMHGAVASGLRASREVLAAKRV